MRPIRVPSVLLLAAASSLAVGPPVSWAAPDIVVGSNQRKTYDCRGGSATVEGGFNVITFRNCMAITIDGGDNTIDAGLAEAIEVSGADNKITWTETADGRRPSITNEGTGNVIASRRGGAGPARAPASSASSRTAPTDRVTVSADGVKVQGSGGTVTVGTEGGGSITIKEDPAGAARGSRGRNAVGAGKIRVDQNGRKEEHDCRGRSAVVNGDGNDLTFRNCHQVAVNGDANTVAVRAVSVVLINGGDNKVTWEQADDGSRPTITDNGRGNTVRGKR